MDTTSIDQRPRTVSATLDPAAFREVMGHYPTGVAVVTGFDGDQPVGMVVGTFSSVSMDPPLVAFMPQVGSGTYARLQRSAAYCINVLAHDQLALCRTMAVPRDDKFDDVDWSRSPLGAPVLADAVAHIHCRPHRTVEAGDHWIVLCEVEAMEVSRPVTPLLFFQGGYGGFSPGGMSARASGTSRADRSSGSRRRSGARPRPWLPSTPTSSPPRSAPTAARRPWSSRSVSASR